MTLRAAYSSSGIGPAVRTVEELVLRLGGAPEETPELEALRRLSQRETEVMRACLEGQPTTQMAQTLHISPHTVRNHLKAIFKKLGVRSRSELFRRFSTIAHVPVPSAPGRVPDLEESED